jgi:WD40 repeat protein
LFQGSSHPDLRRFHAVTGEELPKGGMPRLVYYTPPGTGGYTYEVRGHDGIRAAYLYGVVARRNGTQLAMSTILGDKCAFSIWDLRNPRAVEDRYPGCTSIPKALSPDEKWIAAGGEEGRVLLLAWDKDETRKLEGMHEGKTTAIVFTPTGDRLAVADDRGHIVLADPRDGQIKGRARLPLDHAKHLWISPDGRTLVADTVRGMRVRLRIGARSFSR